LHLALGSGIGFRRRPGFLTASIAIASPVTIPVPVTVPVSGAIAAAAILVTQPALLAVENRGALARSLAICGVRFCILLRAAVAAACVIAALWLLICRLFIRRLLIRRLLIRWLRVRWLFVRWILGRRLSITLAPAFLASRPIRALIGATVSPLRIAAAPLLRRSSVLAGL